MSVSSCSGVDVSNAWLKAPPSREEIAVLRYRSPCSVMLDDATCSMLIWWREQLRKWRAWTSDNGYIDKTIE